MDDKEFGPSYAIGEWVQIISLGWGQVLSSFWTGKTWKYQIRLDTGRIASLLEVEILL